MIKKVALYGQTYYADTKDYVLELLELIQSNNIEICIEEKYEKQLREHGVLEIQSSCISKYLGPESEVDLLFTIGGDGTILRAIHFIKNSNIPILGINTGRLGFLATVQKSEIKLAFQALLSGKYKTNKRTLLEVDVQHDQLESTESSFALNEISVSRKNTASMIGIETHLNGDYLTNYWADGLIVATPTGSTGYSLSCGGPVIDSDSKSLVLSPIAPHNLNARPLVVSDNTEISLKVQGRDKEFLLSLDSRIFTLTGDTELLIKKARFTISIIELEENSFYKTLRSKLLWGEDTRNHK